METCLTKTVPNLKTFLKVLSENPLSVEFDVDGTMRLFETTGEIISKEDGGIYEDGIVDVWTKCIDDGEVIMWGSMAIEVSTIEIHSWDIKEKTINYKTA